ncbi:MAG: excinuclease ABC subunit UvrC [Verrucomicrobiae bacterium]|nr:excinuclease ABC subunit UvrC [Verrucomicrobiae bacterium]
MNINPTIREKLDKLSSKPGVYLMRDRLGRVIYVGKAKALNHRVRSYFQPARYSQMDPKTRALVDVAADLETHEVRNEAEALLLEGKLIKQFRPKYNILFRDDKRFLLVRLTRDPFPRFVLTRLRKPDGCRYFGPFSNSSALRNTLDYLLEHFHIRACRPPEPGERDYQHCHNDIIKHCLAPCVGRISREDYGVWVEKAAVFLDGGDEEALKELEARMLAAAAKKDFETAASLRDALHDLRQTVKQSARKFVRDIPLKTCGGELEELAREFGLSQPPRVIEGFDISHIHGQCAVGSMVRFADGKPSRADYRHFKIEGMGESQAAEQALPELPEALNNDVASIRQVVLRRYRRLRDEKRDFPDLILIDGGKGQLRAALDALAELGVKIPAAGLAKENEEIYLPGRGEPLRLPSTSPALQLLQRVRDESHRFANAFHEGWRRKQIRFSILDELPGIGASRKRLLLRRFGSLERLRKASVEEIREVEGFGGRSAEALWRFLHPDAVL